MTYNVNVEVGILLRGALRRWLMGNGTSYQEYKGLLSSFFVINGLSPSEKQTLELWVFENRE